MYNLNLKKTIRQITLPHRRHPIHLALLNVLLKPLEIMFKDYALFQQNTKRDATFVPHVGAFETELCAMAGLIIGSVQVTDNTLNEGKIYVGCPAGLGEDTYKSFADFMNKNIPFMTAMVLIQHLNYE